MRNLGQTFDRLASVCNDNLVPLRELGEITRLSNRNRILVMDMLLNPSAANIAKRDAEMGKNADSIDKLVKAYKASRLTEKEQQAVPKFEAALSAYLQRGPDPAQALRAGDTDTAEQDLQRGDQRQAGHAVDRCAEPAHPKSRSRLAMTIPRRPSS